MEKVKKLVRAGASIPTAIKECLGRPVTTFADDHELPRAAVSNAINGNVKPSEPLIAALIEEMGGTEAEWRDLLWRAAKPEAAVA